MGAAAGAGVFAGGDGLGGVLFWEPWALCSSCFHTLSIHKGNTAIPQLSAHELGKGPHQLVHGGSLTQVSPRKERSYA